MPGSKSISVAPHNLSLVTKFTGLVFTQKQGTSPVCVEFIPFKNISSIRLARDNYVQILMMNGTVREFTGNDGSALTVCNEAILSLSLALQEKRGM